MKKDFILTPAYGKLLGGSDLMPVGLYHLNVAQADQLCRLHYKQGSLKLVKAMLLILTEEGYVQSDVENPAETEPTQWEEVDE